MWLQEGLSPRGVVLDHERISYPQGARVREHAAEGLAKHRVDAIETHFVEPSESPRQFLRAAVRAAGSSHERGPILCLDSRQR